MSFLDLIFGSKNISKTANLASSDQLSKLNKIISYLTLYHLTEFMDMSTKIASKIAIAAQESAPKGLARDPSPIDAQISIDSIIIGKIMTKTCQSNGMHVRQLREYASSLGLGTLQIGNSTRRLMKAGVINESSGNYTITSEICDMFITEFQKMNKYEDIDAIV